MSPMNEDRFHELKDAYVLGALPEDERVDFEEYLGSHPEHHAEIEELGGLAGMLAFAPPDHDPSPELRAKVMDVVEAESGLPRMSRLRSSSGSGRYAGVRNLALAAAAVLLIGLLSWNVLLQGEVQDLQGQVSESQTRQEQAETPRSDERTIQLEGSWAEQGTQAEVARMDDDRVILVAENLPSVPEDRTLQVWVIRRDVPQPSGLFEPSGNMAATAVTNSLKEGDTIAVTVEPAGGSDQPTTDPVLLKEI